MRTMYDEPEAMEFSYEIPLLENIKREKNNEQIMLTAEEDHEDVVVEYFEIQECPCKKIVPNKLGRMRSVGHIKVPTQH